MINGPLGALSAAQRAKDQARWGAQPSGGSSLVVSWRGGRAASGRWRWNSTGSDVPGDADRLDPLPAVLCGRHIVESQRRVHGRVARGDLDRTPGVRIHRPDVHLVTTAAGRCGTVVADGDRQEVEHQVRIADILVAPDEAARLEMVRRPWAVTQEQPPRADNRAVAPPECWGDRHRELGPRTGRRPRGGPGGSRRRQAGHRPWARPAGSGHSRCPTPESWSNCGELMAPPDKMISPARTRRAGPRPRVNSTPTARFPAKRIFVTKARDTTLRLARPSTGCRNARAGAESSATVDVAVEGREAFLAEAIHVVGQRISRLLHRGEERGAQRARRGRALEYEPRITAELVAARQARLPSA